MHELALAMMLLLLRVPVACGLCRVLPACEMWV